MAYHVDGANGILPTLSNRDQSQSLVAEEAWRC